MHIGWDMAAYMGIRALRELEVVSHNLANASTTGFKRELLSVWCLRLPGEAEMPPPAYVDVLSRDYSQGPLQVTENETDLALEGPGFFKVETPEGIRYTRNGSFRLNEARQLVTREGYPVLGKNGPVTLDSLDGKFSVDDYYAAGPQAGEELEPPNTRVLQGMLEESNLNPVEEAINLILIQRKFESYLKVLDTFATADRQVVEEIGQA
ncbi:MAG: flagellar hook basal-body protein [Deltaproteobacteria bacterium]|nr:flagellar hook basal-body protein [Deltaproteobacteria bacterium]